MFVAVAVAAAAAAGGGVVDADGGILTLVLIFLSVYSRTALASPFPPDRAIHPNLPPPDQKKMYTHKHVRITTMTCRDRRFLARAARRGGP